MQMYRKTSDYRSTMAYKIVISLEYSRPVHVGLTGEILNCIRAITSSKNTKSLKNTKFNRRSRGLGSSIEGSDFRVKSFLLQ